MEKGRETYREFPSKMKKLVSQRKLQHLTRNVQTNRAIKHHNELMETYNSNISQVCNNLKKIRGGKTKGQVMPEEVDGETNFKHVFISEIFFWNF